MGAGYEAVRFIDELQTRGIRPQYVIVTSTDNNPKLLRGIKVVEPNEILDEIKRLNLVVAVSELHKEEVYMEAIEYQFIRIIYKNQIGM